MSEKQKHKEILSSLRGMKDEELVSHEKELHEQLFWLKYKHRSGQTENTASIEVARRSLARIKTLLTERRLSKVSEGSSK